TTPLRTGRRGEGEQRQYRHRTDQRSAKSHSISPFFNLRKHSTTSSLCIKKSLQSPTKTTSGFTKTSSPACSRNGLCTTLCLLKRIAPVLRSQFTQSPLRACPSWSPW